MLHRYIGDKDFRAGMHIYLKRHQYRNTHTEDLWKALEEASGKPVGQVMDTWTKQMVLTKYFQDYDLQITIVLIS